MKNRIIHIFSFIVFITCILSFSSCNNMKARDLRNEVISVINAFLEDDSDEVYQSVKNIISEENFPAKYEAIHAMLDDIETYTLTIVSFQTSLDDGITINEGVFGLYSNVGNFVIDASTRSDTEGLASFVIAEDTDNILPPYEGK